MTGWKLAIAMVCATMAAPAFAQQGAPACATKPALDPAYAAWSAKGETGSTATVAGLKAAALPVGKSFSARLHPTPNVKFAAGPEKPGGATTKGGMFSLTVDKAGAYFVALGTASWIDVVKNGATLKPATFGHGPECSGIRKIVDYALEPGAYVVQVSGAATDAVDVMVGRRP